MEPRAHGAGDTDAGGTHYATELAKARSSFEPHVEQIDRCLSDIDRLEKENGAAGLSKTIGEESLACAKFEQERVRTEAQLAEIIALQESFGRWVKQASNAYGESDPKAMDCLALSTEIMALTSIYEAQAWIYRVKTKQLDVQPWRLKEREDSVAALRESLEKAKSSRSTN